MRAINCMQADQEDDSYIELWIDVLFSMRKFVSSSQYLDFVTFDSLCSGYAGSVQLKIHSSFFSLC